MVAPKPRPEHEKGESDQPVLPGRVRASGEPRSGPFRSWAERTSKPPPPPTVRQSEALAVLAEVPGRTLAWWALSFWSYPECLRVACANCGAPAMPAWLAETGTVKALLVRGWIVPADAAPATVGAGWRSRRYALSDVGRAVLGATAMPPVLPNAVALRLFGGRSRGVTLVPPQEGAVGGPHRHGSEAESGR